MSHILHEGTKVHAVSFDDDAGQLIELENARIVVANGQMSLVPWIEHGPNGKRMYINCALCVMIVPKGSDEQSKIVGRKIML